MNKKFPIRPVLVQFTIGIIIVLIGAGIMFHGNIFGERNSGIATIIGIIGIGIIASSNVHIWKNFKK